ncbi:MAG: hypothetical protein V4687_19125 [Bacteroidota bacterium]
MELLPFLYQVAVTALAGIIIVGFAYFLLRNHITDFLKIKIAAVPEKKSNELLSLQLQAHERLILFVERINPANLLVRLHQQGISISVLQSIVINEINAEYQHNITQQLYVSTVAWEVVRKLKEDTISMVANASKGLVEEASGLDFCKKVLQHLAHLEENPYQLTLDLIKKEIHQQR